MEYRKIPGTNVSMSVLSLGTMLFGGQTSEADSLAIMDFAYEQGINVFDTADIYMNGESERIVGKGLKGKRDKIIVVSKAGNQAGEEMNCAGLSRRHLMASLDASLQRLGTDHIDIFYLHLPDCDTALDETLETMSTMVKAGKIRYIGVSNFPAWQIANMLAICDKRGYVAPVITQNVYNLLTRGVETELVPFLEAHQMGMVAYNPLAGGLLSGKHKLGVPVKGSRYDKRHEQAQTYYDRYWTQDNLAAVEMLRKIAGERELSLLQLAMKWCAQQPHVVSLITGASRLSQLEQNVALLDDTPLDAPLLLECDTLWQDLSGNRFSYIRSQDNRNVRGNSSGTRA